MEGAGRSESSLVEGFFAAFFGGLMCGSKGEEGQPTAPPVDHWTENPNSR